MEERIDDIIHRLLYPWTEDWIIFFPNSIPAKLEKYGFTIICRYSKDMYFHKIWRVWLKNWVCHALLNFKIKMGVASSIFELHPPNFVKMHIFWISTNDINTIFCWLCWYRIWKKDDPVLRPGVKESMDRCGRPKGTSSLHGGLPSSSHPQIPPSQ